MATSRKLGEPGAYLLSSDLSGIMIGGDLFLAASSRFVTSKRGRDLEAEELLVEAIFQTS